MDDHRDQRQQHAQFERAPVHLASLPSAPGHPKPLDQQHHERDDTEDARGDPEVQEQIVRIDDLRQPIGPGGHGVGIAREARTENQVLAHHL